MHSFAKRFGKFHFHFVSVGINFWLDWRLILGNFQGRDGMKKKEEFERALAEFTLHLEQKQKLGTIFVWIELLLALEFACFNASLNYLEHAIYCS